MANPATLPILLKELHLTCMAHQWEPLQEEALADHWTLARLPQFTLLLSKFLPQATG